MKIYKILGKRGRVTIPLEIRQTLGFQYNDVVSFQQSGDAVTVRREKVCDNCKTAAAPEHPGIEAALCELLENVTAEELRTALIRLSVRWAELTRGGDDV